MAVIDKVILYVVAAIIHRFHDDSVKKKNAPGWLYTQIYELVKLSYNN
jgi:hypothetical protein